MLSEYNTNLKLCITKKIDSSLISKYKDVINIDYNSTCFENLNAKVIKENNII